MKKFFAILVCLSIAQSTWGSVAFDAEGTAIDTLSVTSSDFTSLTVGSGSNRALIAQIGWTGVVSGVTVTWDSGGTNQSMVLISSGTAASTYHQTTSLYGLLSPTSGNKTLHVAWTSGATEINLQAVSWTGVSSITNANGALGTSTTASVAITSNSGDIVIGIVASGDVSAISSVSGTQTFLIHGQGNIESGGMYDSGASPSVTIIGNYFTSDSWIIVGANLSGGNSVPVVLTTSPTAISTTTATGNGNVTSDGGATVTDTGVCWATHSNPTSSDTCASSGGGGTGAFTASMTGLTGLTQYIVAAYATNSAGTSYGSDIPFETYGIGSISSAIGTGSMSLTKGSGSVQF